MKKALVDTQLVFERLRRVVAARRILTVDHIVIDERCPVTIDACVVSERKERS